MKHVVRPGECMARIAAQYGFAGYRTLYDHSSNAALKRRRPNPNILAPGDEVVIPPRATKTESVRAGSANHFKVVRPKKVLRLVLQDHRLSPLAGEPYTLHIEGAPAVTGHKTDGGGKLEEPVPLAARRAKLEVCGRVLTLDLGGLQPAADTPDEGLAGIQGRLTNLGYYHDLIDGKPNDAFKVALAVFQLDFDLEPTGELDAATRRKIEEAHQV